MYKNGTSMAAPHVAGAAAMYILRNPAITPEQLQTAFRRYVIVPAGWDAARYGTGILNMDLAQTGANVVIPGDVFGDGRPITTANVTRLRLYLAGHPVSIVRAAADVTGTGNVTTADVTRLRLYLAGHPVRLMPSPLAR